MLKRIVLIFGVLVLLLGGVVLLVSVYLSPTDLSNESLEKQKTRVDRQLSRMYITNFLGFGTLYRRFVYDTDVFFPTRVVVNKYQGEARYGLYGRIVSKNLKEGNVILKGFDGVEREMNIGPSTLFFISEKTLDPSGTVSGPVVFTGGDFDTWLGKVCEGDVLLVETDKAEEFLEKGFIPRVVNVLLLGSSCNAQRTP